MGAPGLTGSPPDENDQAGKGISGGFTGKFQEMIAIATDDDSLRPLGKFKENLIRGSDRQDFPQPLRVVFPIADKRPLRRLQFFHTGDMQNGAIDTPARNPILV